MMVRLSTLLDHHSFLKPHSTSSLPLLKQHFSRGSTTSFSISRRRQRRFINYGLLPSSSSSSSLINYCSDVGSSSTTAIHFSTAHRYHPHYHHHCYQRHLTQYFSILRSLFFFKSSSLVLKRLIFATRIADTNNIGNNQHYYWSSLLLLQSDRTISNTSIIMEGGRKEEENITAESCDNSGSSNNNNNSNSKQRKANRWKQLNKGKKEKRQQQWTKNIRQNKKKTDHNHAQADGDIFISPSTTIITTPHEGSYAHEKMQQLFNVSIITNNDSSSLLPHYLPSNDNKCHDVGIDAPSSTEIFAVNEDDVAIDETTSARFPKRKLTMLISFLGTNYYGFQINPFHRTIQAEIELALYKAGMISRSNFGFPHKYSWSNSARTDKGVHAVAQVCSFKGEMIFHNHVVATGTATSTMTTTTTTSTTNIDTGGEFNNQETKENGTMVNRENCDDDENDKTMALQLTMMRNKVNDYLPSDIRVLDIVKPTRMFCARTSRNKVRYQYMLPSYLLCSREEVCNAFRADIVTKTDENNEEGKSDGDCGNDNKSDMNETMNVQDGGGNSICSDDTSFVRAQNRLVNYRITPDQLAKLRRSLKVFEGTHSFHNYTRRIGANDASSNRYILSFVALDPIMVASPPSEEQCEDTINTVTTQWIPLQIVGQSFLLNQIRKMVSAAVDLARGAVSEETILQSLQKSCRMKVNVAPAQGLFLDRSYYDAYNRNKAKNAAPQTIQLLNWTEEVEGQKDCLSPAVARMEEFKNEKIIPHIVKEDNKEGNFLRYMQLHDVQYFHELYVDERIVQDGDD